MGIGALQMAPAEAHAQDAEDYPATTNISPTVKAAEVELAWSKEPDAPVRQSWRTAWGKATGLLVAGVLLALITAAVGWIAFHPGPAPTVAVSTPAAPAPPPAKSVDDAFLIALSRQNVPVRLPSNALLAAKGVCNMSASGMSKREILDWVASGNSKLTPANLSDFVNLAVQFYCPDAAASL